MGISLPGWQPRSWTAPPSVSNTSFHVVVVGGGLSGCAAGIAAARRGARVLLIEPTHLLGGQMSAGGVGTVDLAPTFAATHEQGLWKEIAVRVRSIYHGLGLTSAVARYRLNDSMAVNTPITDRILTELCHDAGVEVARNCTLSGATITSTGATLQTSIGEIAARVVVEATEDGSVLAMANLPYRIGNLTGVGRVLNGDPTSSEIQRLTQCAVIHRYDDGIPEALRMTTPPTDYTLYRAEIAKYYPGRPWGTTTSDNDFAGYRAYPDIQGLTYYDALDVTKITRTSLNHVNEVQLHADYLTDPAARQASVTAAINQTLAIIYFLQQECSLPWAIALDEGFAEGLRIRTEGITPEMPAWVKHLPTIPYLRESRRLIGAYTLTGRRIRRPNYDRPSIWSSQTVAVGTYSTDLHGSKGPEDLEGYLGETPDDVISNHRGPFIIPFGSLVPRDRRRLVAAEKNISMTRVASGAVRVHPSVTAVGEAAGVIAALSSRLAVAPSEVSCHAVQISLLRGGAILLQYPISGIPASHADYAAVSMALLNGRVSYTLDHPGKRVRLTPTQMVAAKSTGRALVDAWEGPL